MVPENAGLLIAAAFGLAGLCALSVAVPQAFLLARLWRQGSDITPFTAKTVLWTSALGLAMCWRSAVFCDYVWFDQRHLGTIDHRYGIEAAMALYVAVAAIYAAVLYHRTITFGRRHE